MRSRSSKHIATLLVPLFIAATALAACGGSTDVEVGEGTGTDSGVQTEAGPDVTTGLDATADHALPDTSVPDAQPAEGGLDATVIDGGQSDATVVDGGQMDAQPPLDGGQADVIVTDGGTVDATPIDAGPPKEKCGDQIDNDGDGQTDEDGAEGCVNIYSDGDHDGFGQYKIRCTCPPPQLKPGETTNGTDCYDANKDAKPNSQVWGSVDRGDGSFDYNCDKVETQRFLNQGSCQRVMGGCKKTNGWVGAVPACGAAGEWLQSCKVISYKECKPDKTVKKPQECR